MKKFAKSVLYTFSSNVTSFLINVLVVLVIPKIIGVADYGYYQLYILLGTYMTIFHFGWCDGIYLRYVGKSYDKLNKPLLSSQFKGLLIVDIFVTIALFVLSNTVVANDNKVWVYSIASIGVFVVTLKTYTSVIMQMVDKMREYSQIILTEKIIYAIVLIVMISMGIRDFKVLVLSDLIGKMASFLLGIYFCREIIFEKKSVDKMQFIAEAKANIFVGIFLLISNFTSVLITSVVQFFAESKWGIETFSRVSLTFNMSKMLNVVITAVSIVLVPTLKHMDVNQLSAMYKKIRSVLMALLGFMLLFYYPLKIVMSAWLPQYIESLQYMALLFPMCLFESKTQLLANTYLKALRQEKILCVVNVFTVILSIICSYITVFHICNINIAIIMIPYLLAIRCMILEYYIGKKLHIGLIKDALYEIVLATIFIAANWLCKESLIATLIYLIGYIAYIIHIKEELFNVKKEFIDKRLKIK